MILDGPVIPIPPSYSESGLCYNEIEKYINWLVDRDVKIVMTTSGTSQFNLMNNQEIRSFNIFCACQFPHNKIIGIQPVSLQEVLCEIKYYNQHISMLDNTYLMLFFPERYYGQEHVVDFFHEVADVSKVPVFIHGMSMRSGTGGLYDFNANLVNSISKHSNIIGMKEECSSFELAYDLCRNSDPDFLKIVSGKSARRFTLLRAAGAHTYLAGLGNIFPKLDQTIFNWFKIDKNPFKMLKEFEDPFFDVFMKIGWHKALRECLKQEGLCCSNNRKPFPDCTQRESETIMAVVESIKKKLTLGNLTCEIN